LVLNSFNWLKSEVLKLKPLDYWEAFFVDMNKDLILFKFEIEHSKFEIHINDHLLVQKGIKQVKPLMGRGLY